jgi:hypothetical protein
VLLPIQSRVTEGRLQKFPHAGHLDDLDDPGADYPSANAVRAANGGAFAKGQQELAGMLRLAEYWGIGVVEW